MKPNPRGKRGEDYAAHVLREQGYEILARNASCRMGEVDIVAARDGVIAFIEVKTRRRGSMVSGVSAVTRAKQRRIIAAAMWYLHTRPCALQPRFDIFCVETGSDGEPCGYENFLGAFDCEAYEKRY